MSKHRRAGFIDRVAPNLYLKIVGITVMALMLFSLGGTLDLYR